MHLFCRSILFGQEEKAVPLIFWGALTHRVCPSHLSLWQDSLLPLRVVVMLAKVLDPTFE